MPTETNDTLNMASPGQLPWEPVVCRETEAPAVSPAESAGMTMGTVQWLKGLQPETRSMLPGYDPGVVCLLLGVFMLLTLNFNHYSIYLKTFSQDLWSVRRRDNAFNVRTISETRVQMSLLLLTCMCEGILLYSATSATPAWTLIGVFPTILALTGIAAVYYVWQVAAYSLVGFVFADRITSRQWLKGFSASQTLLGLTLTVPALLVLFNPGMTPTMVPIAVFLYFIARFIFISKGFRLFYHNFDSLLYFILYLCTLEIIPLIILLRAYNFIAYFQP